MTVGYIYTEILQPSKLYMKKYMETNDSAAHYLSLLAKWTEKGGWHANSTLVRLKATTKLRIIEDLGGGNKSFIFARSIWYYFTITPDITRPYNPF